jgi:16S rRNA (cytidine1402-2'-O)-methyltransferase
MLYVIGTPIGNMEDCSPRARAALAAASVVACEDTRRTGRLFQLLGLKAPTLIALHEHNEAKQIPPLIKTLQRGERVALVSDGGMPSISDPGTRLVAAAHTAGVKIEVIGGPTALTNAVAGSGLVGRQAGASGLVFLGFPPRTAKARVALFTVHAAHGLPLVLYENPTRVAALCAAALQVLGNRPACVARELTKLHESWYGPDLATLAQLPTLKGECVVVIGGADSTTSVPVAAPTAAEVSSLKDLAALVAAQCGVGKQAAYKALTQLKETVRE